MKKSIAIVMTVFLVFPFMSQASVIPVLGDANGNGIVDAEDYAIVSAANPSTPEDISKWDARADVIVNGSIDDTDVFTVLANMGHSDPIRISSIAITTPASKLVYTVGDTLDIAGLVVTGRYYNGAYIVETVDASNVSGFDSSTPVASQTLTVTVDGMTATYDISVVAPVVPEPISEPSNSSSGGNVGNGTGYYVGNVAQIFAPSNPVTPTVVSQVQVLGVSDFKFSTYLQFGMSGNDVKELQELLRKEGYFTYPVSTGYFGPITLAAVKAYQGEHGLPETGFVGPLTIAELNK